MKWVVIVPPYGKENIYYLQSPLPGTSKFATGKGSALKTIQMINGGLEQALVVDFGWSKARIYPDGQDLKMEFTGGSNAANQRWTKERIRQKNKPECKKFVPRKENKKSFVSTIFNRVKRFLPF